jgi:hypothetical protein
VTTWAELFPNGRLIFYEGDNPERFVRTLRRRFSLDPRRDPNWAEMRAFHCPARLLDAVYWHFPMGS